MSWENAPSLNKLTASQQGGNRGAQLWGVDYRGRLHTIYQKSPGGAWSNWQGVEWNPTNHPKEVYELAACQLANGGVQLWVLDMKREIWTAMQFEQGGSWNGWWHSTSTKWNKSQWNFKKIACTQMADGAMFIGVKDDGQLAVAFNTGGKWGRWRDNFHPTPQDSRWIEFTACRQGDGRVALWGLDDKRQLWGAGEIRKGEGDMGPWNGPNWMNAPRLRNIAAVEGRNGAIIVAQDEDYRVIFNSQMAPGTNNWTGWWQLGGANAPQSYELTAAGQNDGRAQVWAITLGGKLTTIYQRDTTNWVGEWTHKDDPPPPPKH
jgi:hypothetical protein